MKTILIRIAQAVAGLLLMVATLIAVEYLGGQPMGLFAGLRPTGLGFANEQFKPPSWKPNTVSSTVAKNDSHYIEPLTIEGDSVAAWAKLRALVKAEASATIVSESAGYLYAEYKSRGLGFVDDVEFALDAKNNRIHVRSASRLGVRDFGVNLARIEAIRTQFSAR